MQLIDDRPVDKRRQRLRAPLHLARKYGRRLHQLPRHPEPLAPMPRKQEHDPRGRRSNGPRRHRWNGPRPGSSGPGRRCSNVPRRYRASGPRRPPVGRPPRALHGATGRCARSSIVAARTGSARSAAASSRAAAGPRRPRGRSCRRIRMSSPRRSAARPRARGRSARAGAAPRSRSVAKASRTPTVGGRIPSRTAMTALSSPRDPGRRLQVPDARLHHRSDRQRREARPSPNTRPERQRPRSGRRPGVPDPCASTYPTSPAATPGPPQRARDRGHLCLRARHGEAVPAPVVGDRAAEDHGVHRIPVPQRPVEPLEHDHPRALAADIPVRPARRTDAPTRCGSARRTPRPPPPSRPRARGSRPPRSPAALRRAPPPDTSRRDARPPAMPTRRC